MNLYLILRTDLLCPLSYKGMLSDNHSDANSDKIVGASDRRADLASALNYEGK